MTGDPMQSNDLTAWEKFKPYPSRIYETKVKPSKKVEVFNDSTIKQSGMPKRLLKLEKLQIKHEKSWNVWISKMLTRSFIFIIKEDKSRDGSSTTATFNTNFFYS